MYSHLELWRGTRQKERGEGCCSGWFVTDEWKLDPVKSRGLASALWSPPSSWSILSFPREVLRTWPSMSEQWPAGPGKPSYHTSSSRFLSWWLLDATIVRPDWSHVAENPNKLIRFRFISLMQKQFGIGLVLQGHQGSRFFFFCSTVLRPWHPGSKLLYHPVWLLYLPLSRPNSR